MEVLDGVRDEIAIEKIILAEEIKTMSPTILEEYRKRFSDDMIEFIPHSELLFVQGSMDSMLQMLSFR